MKPEDKQELIDLINSSDAAAEQVYKVLRALTVAKMTGRAIVSPKSRSAPIVIISFSEDLKQQVEKQLAAEGVPPTWRNDDIEGDIIGISDGKAD